MYFKTPTSNYWQGKNIRLIKYSRSWWKTVKLFNVRSCGYWLWSLLKHICLLVLLVSDSWDWTRSSELPQTNSLTKWSEDCRIERTFVIIEPKTFVQSLYRAINRTSTFAIGCVGCGLRERGSRVSFSLHRNWKCAARNHLRFSYSVQCNKSLLLDQVYFTFPLYAWSRKSATNMSFEGIRYLYFWCHFHKQPKSHPHLTMAKFFVDENQH